MYCAVAADKTRRDAANPDSYAGIVGHSNLKDDISGGDSNKMKKLHERLITAAGVAILVAIFCYQVAYGHTSSCGI
jgi:hypothetical protein